MSDAEEITKALTPVFPEDGKRAAYLSYRIAGFNMREAAELVKVKQRTIMRWREADSEFADLDTIGLAELRKQLGFEYLNIEFTRNYKLVLQKDFDVLFKAAKNQTLSEEEHQYLLKIRQHYTPQQLVLIKQLAGEVERGDDFNFTKLTFTIKREREEINVKTE